MSFPTSTPSYAGFTSTHTLSQDIHAAQHNSEQTDIVGLANKVGIGAATPTNATVLRGNGVGTSSWSQVNVATDITGLLPQSNGGTGTNLATGSGAVVYQNSPTLNTATLTSPVINSPTGNWLQSVYPVGCIYTEITGANPNTTFGFGTWTQFGQGQVLVGQLNADTNFGTVLGTGGEVTHTLTTAEMPAHTHTPAFRYLSPDYNGGTAAASGSATWAADQTVSASTGGGGAHNNLQPFIVVYFWRRTA